jgi:opacity protein-like surface antigen
MKWIVKAACVAAMVMGLTPGSRAVAGPEDVVNLVQPAHLDTGLTDAFAGVTVENVACENCSPKPQWYVAGIVGASFASLTTAGGPNSDPNWNPAAFSGTVNDTLFTGGGAIGMAIPRPSGALRVEFEGRGRDLQDGVETLTIVPPNGPRLPNDVRACDGWSTMANLWRDVRVNDRVGFYLGGGIGGGGYRLSTLAAFDVLGASVDSSDAVAAFAWQAGTGVYYHLTDRIILDLGYRFMAIDSVDTPLLYNGPDSNGGGIVQVTGQPYGTLTTGFSTSELLLSIRIMEPFRRWR